MTTAPHLAAALRRRARELEALRSTPIVGPAKAGNPTGANQHGGTSVVTEVPLTKDQRSEFRTMAAHTDVVEATIEESTRGRRYPFQAIEALLPPTTSDLTYACGRLNPREAGALLGVCRRTILRWRARGVDEWTADRLACALNLHPAVVWPDWLDEQPIRVKKVNAGTPVSRNEPARVKNEAA